MANSFWQREKGMKKMNSISFVFKVWKTRKLKKAFDKGIRRCSKRLSPIRDTQAYDVFIREL